MMVEDFTNSYLTHMQTSRVENICSQIFLLPICVTTVKECCRFSWRKKEGGEAGIIPEDGNACSCCCLGLTVGAPLGLAWCLCMPPSLPQKRDEKQKGEAPSWSPFSSAAGKRCSLWIPLAWCLRLPCLLLWPGSAFHLSSSNIKNALFLLCPDQISIEEKLVKLQIWRGNEIDF